jgi:Leucine rich repeat
MYTKKSISIIFSVLLIVVMTSGNASASSLNAAVSTNRPLPTSQNFTVTPTTTNCALVIQIPQSECAALVALYNSTNGASWWSNWEWLQTNTPCSWYGVTCGSGHVKKLDLSYNFLSGFIPSALGNLTQLTVLDFNLDYLSGTIPSQLGNLTQLTYLDISSNYGLGGSLPISLDNLYQLQTFYFDGQLCEPSNTYFQYWLNNIPTHSDSHICKYYIKNGGFNAYIGTSKIPEYWAASNFKPTDGKDTTFHQEGTASVKITGIPGVTKTLTQTISVSGFAQDTFGFSFQAKGSSIPVGGVCAGQVKLYHGTTLVSIQTVNCAMGTYGFQLKTSSITTSNTYNKIVVVFTYSKASGTVWFDAASLLK